MKVNITGNVATIVSEIKFDAIKEIEVYQPESLVLFDEDRNPVFAISTGDTGEMNGMGIVFGGKTPKGFACINLVFDSEIDDIKQFVVDHYGLALNRLAMVERQVEAAESYISTLKRNVEDSINVADI